MKKKYIPAELEIVFANVCDVITSSVIVPPEPEEPGGSGTGGGETGGSTGGSGIGGTYNPDAWLGI